MQKRTLGVAGLLFALSAAAIGQVPSGLPDTPSVPGPHDDTVSKYNDYNAAGDDNLSSLPDALGKINGTSPVARQYGQALDEYKADKLDAAAKDLQAVLKLEPGNAPAHKLLAYTLLRQNKPADALPHLQLSVKATPQDVQTRDNLGRVYLALNRPTDAAAQFKASLALSPKDAIALRGLTQTTAKTPTGATAGMPTASPSPQPKKSDLSAQDYAKKGAELLKADKFDEAMDAYNKAADLDSRNADLRLYIGEQYEKAGKTDKAIAAIGQALTMDTKHVFEAHTMLGQLYAPTDPAKAASEFKMASDAKPSDPATWYNLGVMHTQAGDTADAKQDYKKVLDLKPADAALTDHARQNLAALGK